VLLVLHVELQQGRRVPVGDALNELHPVESGEHQLRARLLRDLRDVKRDRRVGDDAGDEDPLALENACHDCVLLNLTARRA
jgi:hypothetical protein